MPRNLAFAVITTAGMFAGGYAMAWDSADWPADRLLAGEIIIVPQKGTGKTPSNTSSAAEQRERARSYQNEGSAANQAIIVLPDEESEGALSPRGGAPDSKARENRARARDYQHGTDSSVRPSVIRPETSVPMDGGTTQERAHDNRARAAGYSRGESQAGFSGRVGPDGIPLVSCKDRDNIAGQIGDDLSSGSVIVILRDGKQVKVRCQ